ncbi:MAG: response regulator transcription factor [Arenicellales bacterium]
MTNETTVFVIDDDDGVRESLRWLLESAELNSELHPDGEDFLTRYEPGRLGCVVLDVRMPRMDGLEVNRRLRAIDPTIPVIVVTGHADVPMATQAMREGAFDLIEKPYSDDALLERIHAAVEKHRDQLDQVEHHSNAFSLWTTLTQRETEILEYVFNGKTNRETADELNISIKTVELHRANLMKKLGAGGTADLVRITAELKLLNF